MQYAFNANLLYDNRASNYNNIDLYDAHFVDRSNIYLLKSLFELYKTLHLTLSYKQTSYSLNKNAGKFDYNNFDFTNNNNDGTYKGFLLITILIIKPEYALIILISIAIAFVEALTAIIALFIDVIFIMISLVVEIVYAIIVFLHKYYFTTFNNHLLSLTKKQTLNYILHFIQREKNVLLVTLHIAPFFLFEILYTILTSLYSRTDMRTRDICADTFPILFIYLSALTLYFLCKYESQKSVTKPEIGHKSRLPTSATNLGYQHRLQISAINLGYKSRLGNSATKYIHTFSLFDKKTKS